MPDIISVSRRTDIPMYFANWFALRRSEGRAEFRNAFGGKGTVSLRNEDVLGYLFWTKYALPFADQLQSLWDDGVPYVFQYTITGYGRDLEPYVPNTKRAIDNFVVVSHQLPSPECIQWRYDPIILCETYSHTFHLKNFRRIAKALQGATHVVNTSFVEPYVKTIRRLADPSVLYRRIDPNRHKAVSVRYPDLLQVGHEGHVLLDELKSIAREYGMELRACSNPEWDLPLSQCCGMELFEPYGSRLVERLTDLPEAPSRISCRCLKSVDIGMDNTCLAGCPYCYVVISHQTAVNNFRRHSPTSTMLR